MNSNKRVVVVCTTEETAKYISNTIFENFKLENIVNQSKTQIIFKQIRSITEIRFKSIKELCILISAPGKYSPRIVICSDDHLLELSIKSADHIIHYDLPDSFEIFSLRYSVFTKSHSILRVGKEPISDCIPSDSPS